jgi:transcriptional regulator with XRE-family HTH domain
MEELRRLRKQRGLTQAKLAVQAGLDPSSLSQIETGARRPNTRTLEKLAGVLGVEVVDLFPKAQSPLPLEQPLTASPEVRDWLEEHGARFALMTAPEFSDLVLNMEAAADDTDLLEGIERLVEEITEEDRAVERALMREFRQGGLLFPNTPAGPNLTERAFARHKAVVRLRRALANEYQVLRRSLANYSMRLHWAGRTSDFLVHPRLKETLRRQLLEAALAEESAA